MTRRRWLVVGAMGLVVSAGRPVAAGVSGEAEGSLHGGMAAGPWTCGSNAQVKYGGLGAKGRVWLAERQASPTAEPSLSRAVPEGFSLGGAVATELRSYSLWTCETNPCSDSITLPSTRPVGAASLSIVYDFPSVRLRFGALTWQRYTTNSNHLNQRFLPDFSVRLGRDRALRVDFGLGAYSTDTLFRPGAYFGLIFPVKPTTDLAARLGIHEVFDSFLGIRADVAPTIRMGESSWIAVGGGLSTGPKSFWPHARLSLGAAF